MCPRCYKPHSGFCTAVCSKCNKQGHRAKDCKGFAYKATTNESVNVKDNASAPKVCYECGKPRHVRDTCPNKKKAGANAHGAFNINARDAEEDPELVTGTFSVNNLLVYVLFDSGAVLSFVSSKINPRISTPLSSLDRNYTVEVANGEVLKAKNVDLDGEPLMIYEDKKCKQLNLISCLKVQKYLRKGCHVILAHVSKLDPKERQLSDVAVAMEFPEVFLEDLPGLPLHRAVEFQIDLAPAAAPVARAPYRLTPT
ncbi:uncharacterized protein [Rutidosis leptorrhynchoides]|uniref:uncharacterized protein n=1 Tax=Rutidosis leptorrhynchoides TaxID=125765 RepID=UPI003A9A5E99